MSTFIFALSPLHNFKELCFSSIVSRLLAMLLFISFPYDTNCGWVFSCWYGSCLLSAILETGSARNKPLKWRPLVLSPSLPCSLIRLLSPSAMHVPTTPMVMKNKEQEFQTDRVLEIKYGLDLGMCRDQGWDGRMWEESKTRKHPGVVSET